ncbi:MAG: permease-like cell division protein FtsX [Pseudomonadales bacterium]|nr:permease-like cell division protein FtsX [Pseudomonadales bacterium]
MSETKRRVRTRPQGKESPAGTGASQASGGSIASWAVNHMIVARQSLAGLLDTFVSSLMTWLVIGIALALPTILYLLLANVGELTSTFEGKPRISVYLADQVTVDEGEAFSRSLDRLEGVASTKFISPDDALTEFKAMSGFGDVLEALPGNPLPAVVEVVPSVEQPAELRLLVTGLSSHPEVSRVSVDLEWVERLFALLTLGERFVTALAFFLSLGVLLSIGNTIRLAIENRRSEIEVVKLVGGTDSFVRRPFLYLGFWYGFGGAVIAVVMVEASLVFLGGPVDRLVHSYHDRFVLSGLGPGTAITLMITGGLLGVLGAVVAVSRHLHAIEPR